MKRWNRSADVRARSPAQPARGGGHRTETASVPLILHTLVADDRLAAGVVSGTTVARLYRDAGLERERRIERGTHGIATT